MKKCIYLFTLFIAFSTNAQTWTPLTFNENQPNLELNPLKGIAALFGSDNGFPHSISSKTFAFGELVNDTGGFDFAGLDQFIEDEAQLGHFTMIQVNMDNAKLINPLDTFVENGIPTYVGEKYDLPDFLASVNRLYYQGRPEPGQTQNTDVNANVFPWDPADGGGNPSLVVDYNDTTLVDAMVALITELGNKYDQDERVFIVHYGMYGIFGEWGLGAGKVYIDDLVDENGINLGLVAEDWEMNNFNQGRIINAYQDAFDNTNLVARVPELPRPQSTGYSDGLYFGASLSDDPIFNYFFLPTLERFNVDQNWRNQVIGGEMDPELQSKIWGELSPNDDFNYTVIGDSRFTQGQDVEQNVKDVFEQTHPTFIFQNYMLQQQFVGLEGGNHFIPDTPDPENFPYAGQSNQAFWDIAIKATKKMGYTFYVNEFNVSAANGNPAVEVNIQNTGIAPMYANWDIEFGYLNATNDGFVSLGKSSAWNLDKILPDNNDNKRTLISTESLADGDYTFMLRIVNPLKEGIILPDGTPKVYPNATPVRFANETQDLDLDGWLTLGTATILNGALGSFPIVATSLERDENFESTMNLDSQQDLNVIVALASTPITWVSNSTQVAAVDQNGMVTTFAEAGEVVITAFTEDGQEVVFDITVSNYWEIPGLIEAEDFFVYSIGSPTNPGAREMLIQTGDDAGETAIGFIGDFDVFEYPVYVKQETDFILDFRAASFSGQNDSKMEIRRENDVLVEEVTLGGQGVPNGNYGTFSSNVFTIPAGNSIIKLRVTRSNFDLNWIAFRTCFDSTTYTIPGGWDNGVPDANKSAIISENYDTATIGLGDIIACSLTVSSGAILNIADGNFVQVENSISIDGTLLVAHQGSIVQVNNDSKATNNGTINVELTTPPLRKRDFMVMGSPMNGETREDVFANAFFVLSSTPTNFYPFSGVPNGGTNFADDKTINGKFWDSHNGAINSGEGYIVRPQTGYNDPAYSGPPVVEELTFDMTYTQGTLNNGVILRTIAFNGLGDNPSGTPNILANPYASPISGASLIANNNLINELFFWEHLTPPSTSFPGSNGINFSMDDISIFNGSMGIPAVNDPGITTTPNGVIATGQGFAIKAQSPGTVSFNNNMRLISGNTTLRNPAEALTLDQMLLEVRNADYGLGSYTGIAFNPQATLSVDLGMDTQRLATTVSLYSHLQDGSSQLGIQTMPKFENGMKIPLGFATQVDAEIEYVISIANTEGNQISSSSVYLVDHLEGIVTNLRENAYSFKSGMQTYDGRFTLQFIEESVLGVQDNFAETVHLYPNPSRGLVAISSHTAIKSIILYDTAGRSVLKPTSTREFNVASLHAGVYFVEIIAIDNRSAIKRVIKQ